MGILKYRSVLLVGAALAVVMVSLSTTGTSVQAQAACPTGVTLTLRQPTTAAPTTVLATVSGNVNIRPPTANDANSFFLAYFVDTSATASGQTIPTDNPRIIRSGNTTQNVGPLTTGSHSVNVVLARQNGVACDIRASVTFNVAQGTAPTATASPTASATAAPTVAPTVAPTAAPTAAATPKATVTAPKSGSGGFAREGSGAALVAMLLIAAAGVLVVGGRLATRNRR